MTAALLALLLGALPSRAAATAEDPPEALDRIHKLDMRRLGSYSAQRFLEHEALDQLPAAPQLLSASKTPKTAPEAVESDPTKPVELNSPAANAVSAAASRAAQQIYVEARDTLSRPAPVKQAAAAGTPATAVATRTPPPASSRPRRVTPENAAMLDVSLEDAKEGNKEFDNNLRTGAGTGPAGAKKPERIYSNAKLPVE